MRTFTVACLLMGLFLQMGCAAIPRMTAQRKPKPNPKIAADYLAAKEFESQNKQERARELYEKLLARDSKNPEYLHRLAVVCTRLQRYGEATNYFERAQTLAPKNASLLVDMGYSSYLRGDHGEAERLLREAVHLKPSDKRAINNLALVVGRRGKIEESLSLLKQVDDEATALTGLAYIHTQRGEMDLAEQRYREALAKDPNHKDATKALAELEKRHPRHDTVIADSVPTKMEAFHLTEIPGSDFDAAPVIQQVATVEDKESERVTTASFEEESFSPNEPALLDKSQERAKPVVTSKIQQISFDDDEPFDQKVAPAAPIAVTDRWIVEPADDDWSSDDRTSTKSASVAPSMLPVDFDLTSGDDFAPKKPPVSSPTPTASTTASQSPPVKQLKFVASKSRLPRPAALAEGKSLSTSAAASDQRD